MKFPGSNEFGRFADIRGKGDSSGLKLPAHGDIEPDERFNCG